MVVEVLIFGAAAHAARADRVAVRLDEAAPANAGTVMAAIAAQHPALAHAARDGRLAVNHRYVPTDHPIRSTDELALIALLGGG